MTAPWSGVALGLDGGRVLLGPLGTLLVARALRLAEQVARRDGTVFDPTISAVLAELVAVVAAEAAAARVAAPGPAALPRDADVATSVPPHSGMGTQEAAGVLSIKARAVRAAASRGAILGHRSSGGAWVLDTDSVELYARLRQERRKA